MISQQSVLSPRPSLISTTSATLEEEHRHCSAAAAAAAEHEQSQNPTPQHQGMSSPAIPSQPQGKSTAVYPSALALHDAVIADRDLFYDTLNKFHASLGTRLTIPTIGGKELDLHILYLEVSSRGGLEQVIKERKWKEVTVVFNFPPTTTSASFVLRKYYVSLLHHYEQVYFFGTQGQLVPPPIAASLPNQSPGHQLADNGVANNGGPELGDVAIKKRKRKSQDPIQLNGDELAVPIGHAVSGVIDGKFDRGYLVTVSMGTEKLRGILYHLPTGSVTPQFATVSEMAKGIVVDCVPEVRRRRRRRRKDEMPKKDPNAPKPNRSGYNFFFQEQRRCLKVLYPDKDKELSKMIGELWNKQTEEERAIYQERGIKDKERYKKEMEEYRDGLKSQACGEGSGGTYGDGSGDVLLPVMESAGRPDLSMSSLSEADSLPMAEEDLKADVGTSSYNQ